MTENQRKILYSPGFGAGWTTWFSGSPEAKRFMLEYAPFVEALETYTGTRLWYADQERENFLRCPDELNDDQAEFRKLCEQTFPGAEMLTCIYRIPEGLDLARFCEEFKARFPEESTPYLGGLDDLKVKVIPKRARIRINEYDGSESVEVEGDYEGWM